MQEDFLHYIWQYQKLPSSTLTTVAGEKIQVLNVGDYNTNSGPDFFNAKVSIGAQIWVGTVEMHLKASDWFLHQHQNDVAYNNVILHVVWEDDVAVFDRCNNQLQTLVLKNHVEDKLLLNYKKLLQKKNWINCENQINSIDEFTLSFWKEKLLVKRLEQKSLGLQSRLLELGNDWEALLFLVLAENFGLKINSDEFLQLTKNITFKTFKKELPYLINLEALLFGQSNLLKADIDDFYYKNLKKEFTYLKQKHQLKESLITLQFFRMRPSGFPTLRLSQLAVLYHYHKNLFSKVIEVSSIDGLRKLFSVSASEYWDTHYTFGKCSVKRKKSLSNAFIDVLIINAIIPLKFIYAKLNGVDNFEELLSLYTSLKPEQNTIVKKFQKLAVKTRSAADTQALIELKTRFCDRHKCLQCEIGNKLLYPL